MFVGNDVNHATVKRQIAIGLINGAGRFCLKIGKLHLAFERRPIDVGTCTKQCQRRQANKFAHDVFPVVFGLRYSDACPASSDIWPMCARTGVQYR